MKRELLGAGDFSQLLLKSMAMTTNRTMSILYIHLLKSFMRLFFLGRPGKGLKKDGWKIAKY
jgi:hypothetical protein